MKKLTVDCPITKVAQIMSDTWTMLIVHNLLNKPQRFCDLEDLLPGISTRTLALKLKKLAEDSMVKKTSTGAYELTAKGKGLKVVEKAMENYEEQYLR